MVRCSGCRAPVSYQKFHGLGAYPCLRCHTIAFSETAFENLVPRAELARHFVEDRRRGAGGDCFLCHAPTRGLRARSPVGAAHPENLWLFGNWRAGSSLHLHGPLALGHCGRCGAYRLSARALCRIPIDWETREIEHQAAERARELRLNDEPPREPVQAALTGHFLMPFFENLPRSRARSYVCWYLLLVVAFVNWLGYRDPWIVHVLGYDASRALALQPVAALTSALVHPGLEALLPNVLCFAVYAPVVERELRPRGFAILLAVSAAAGYLLQALLGGTPAPGMHAAVAGLVAFFGARFPRAVVGWGSVMGSVRVLAPTATLIYLAFGLVELATARLDGGNFASLGFVGGMLAGLAAHRWTEPGRISVAFREDAKRRHLPERARRELVRAG